MFVQVNEEIKLYFNYFQLDPNKYKDFDPFCDKENEPVLIGIAVAEPRCVLHRVMINFSQHPIQKRILDLIICCQNRYRLMITPKYLTIKRNLWELYM